MTFDAVFSNWKMADLEKYTTRKTYVRSYWMTFVPKQAYIFSRKEDFQY